jgi:hypothetical protein
VTVGNHAPVPIVGDPSKDSIVFGDNHPSPTTKMYGFVNGTLNRLTGAVSIQIIDDGPTLAVIAGICKPAQQLF